MPPVPSSIAETFPQFRPARALFRRCRKRLGDRRGGGGGDDDEEEEEEEEDDDDEEDSLSERSSLQGGEGQLGVERADATTPRRPERRVVVPPMEAEQANEADFEECD